MTAVETRGKNLLFILTFNLEFEMGVVLIILASLFAWLIYKMALISVTPTRMVSFFGYAVYILLSIPTLLIKDQELVFIFISILTCGFGLFLGNLYKG